jgi:hypothetical protein
VKEYSREILTRAGANVLTSVETREKNKGNLKIRHTGQDRDGG